jgi:diguanylate cyclase (GGDEF)-like protein/PAS domain S-box-containing protein
MNIFTRIASSLGIKQRLLILVLLAVAPLVALIVWNAADDRRAAIEQAAVATQQSARMAALRQSAVLSEAITTTESMRSIPTISIEGGDHCRAQLDRLEAMHPSFNTIGVLSPDGVIVCHTLLDEPKKVSLPGILDAVLRDDAPDVYVSHFLHGPVTGHPVIFVARPLLTPWGSKIGVVYISIDLNAFSELADQISGQNSRTLMMIEPDTGIVLASSASGGLKLGSVFPDDGLVEAMRAQPNGGHVEVSLNGARTIFGFAPLPGAETSGAMVAVGTPRHDVLASVNQQTLLNFGLALAAIALAVCSAWLLGYYGQVRPAKQLADVAERIGEGNLDARATLETWQAPEFRRLAVTLDEMAERLQLTNQAFKASEARYKLLAENTADLVTHIDSGGVRTYASPASLAILGYTPQELTGGDPLGLAHPQDRPQLGMMLEALQLGAEASALQYRARRKDGTYVWVEVTGRALGGDLGVMVSLRDISRRKTAEDRLEEANRNLHMLASTDGLTGLANRRSFDKALTRELARCARDGLPLALLLVDVDHFKSYNDSYGHQEGDECLKRLSHLLRGMARRPGDVAARYGGEEFAVVLPNTSAEGGQHFAESLRAAVEALNIPHCRSSHGVVTVSIGLACELPIAGSEAAMLQNADAALYSAKENGRNRAVVFNGSTMAMSARLYGA